MADSEESREVAISETETETERINCIRSIGRSLVAIRDYAADEYPCDSLVFPPANHENLPVGGDFNTSFSSESSMSSSSQFDAEDDDYSSSFSPSDSNSSDPPLSKPPPPITVVASSRWWDFGIQVLHSKFNTVLTQLKGFGLSPWPILSSCRSTLAVAVLGFIYFRWWRRRRLTTANTGSMEQLTRIIKEQDKRINQLLDQIAETNKVLVALQRGHLSKPS